MKIPNGTLCHDLLVEKMRPALSFDETANYKEWKEQIREKFLSLTGLDDIPLNACEDKFEIESEEKKDGYRQIRFTFCSENGSVVPCYLLVPDLGKEKYPTVITLQGHTTGFHNSIGVIKYDEDKAGKERNDFAVQAVKRGYAALALEMRAMCGERTAFNVPFRKVNHDERIGRCYYESVTAALIGRTVIGERCWDISRAIDVIEKQFPCCDTENLIITGNSGGGTASFYAAAYDERIKVCMPSSSFCPFKESILRFYHCSCNYIPHAYKYFDMQDVACLIAPRKLVIVTGQLDQSFLVDGVRRGYDTVEKIYKKENALDKCKLIVTANGHWWNGDIMWAEANNALKELK